MPPRFLLCCLDKGLLNLAALPLLGWKIARILCYIHKNPPVSVVCREVGASRAAGGEAAAAPFPRLAVVFGRRRRRGRRAAGAHGKARAEGAAGAGGAARGAAAAALGAATARGGAEQGTRPPAAQDEAWQLWGVDLMYTMAMTWDSWEFACCLWDQGVCTK